MNSIFCVFIAIVKTVSYVMCVCVFWTVLRTHKLQHTAGSFNLLSSTKITINFLQSNLSKRFRWTASRLEKGVTSFWKL